MYVWVQTKKSSPFESLISLKTDDHTEHATSGKEAASRMETPFGIGKTWPSGTFTFSA